MGLVAGVVSREGTDCPQVGLRVCANSKKFAVATC